MSEKEISIVIPIYKSSLTNNEIKSLKRCCEVLNKYPITLVCFEELDIDKYLKILEQYDLKYKLVYFNKHYFQDISSYNRLMLSKEFYESFISYKYILIYQLDAYVFRDELEFWCKKDYDYVGAPLIGNYYDMEFSQVMRVGNGGFSLRKVKTYIDFFNSKKNVHSFFQISNRIKLWKKPYSRIFVFVLMVFGWRNKPKSVAQRWRYNEDDFWSGYLDNSNYSLKKPTPDEALNFAFERFPKECFQIIQKLPFGCHAWEKYEYDDFWSKYME